MEHKQKRKVRYFIQCQHWPGQSWEDYDEMANCHSADVATPYKSRSAARTEIRKLRKRRDYGHRDGTLPRWRVLKRITIDEVV
jgi:hypothetical protein